MAELDDLRRKLAAREGKPGYEENARDLKARIAELERVKDAGEDGR